MTVPLVRSDTFIRATRETGYRSTAYAVAELVDNAIQASADLVNILIEKEETAGCTGLIVSVIDDGVGMSVDEISQALQFGGSTRFNNRCGQGRFGMGLPNASLSQAKRVDVYSWSDRDCALHASLDSDAITAGHHDGIAAVRSDVPLPVRRIGGSRGTAVIWSKCDRIVYQRPGMLARNLHRELGRMFRRFLEAKVEIRINGEIVVPVDPIRISPRPNDPGDVSLLPTLVFPFLVAPTTASSEVRVTFAILPVEQWSALPNHEKRMTGISGAGTVSVLRAGREIALGWYLMGSKRRENYDDWWRCEISFEPTLDELFGVSHSKQGIRPSPALIEAMTPTLENQARVLNRAIRERFAAMKERLNTPRAIAHSSHHKLCLNAEQCYETRRAERQPTRTLSPTYSIEVRPSGEADFISAVRRLDSVILSVNSDHPFYHRLYLPLTKESPRRVSDAFELSLLALARVLASAAPEEKSSWNGFLESWSDAMALLLEER